MDIQALRLEAGETVGDGLEPFPYGIEMVKAFLQAEVAQIVGTEFVAQEARTSRTVSEMRVSSTREKRDGRAGSDRSRWRAFPAVSCPAGRRRSRGCGGLS